MLGPRFLGVERLVDEFGDLLSLLARTLLGIVLRHGVVDDLGQRRQTATTAERVLIDPGDSLAVGAVTVGTQTLVDRPSVRVAKCG